MGELGVLVPQKVYWCSEAGTSLEDSSSLEDITL